MIRTFYIKLDVTYLRKGDVIDNGGTYLKLKSNPWPDIVWWKALFWRLSGYRWFSRKIRACTYKVEFYDFLIYDKDRGQMKFDFERWIRSDEGKKKLQKLKEAWPKLKKK